MTNAGSVLVGVACLILALGGAASMLIAALRNQGGDSK